MKKTILICILCLCVSLFAQTPDPTQMLDTAVATKWWHSLKIEKHGGSAFTSNYWGETEGIYTILSRLYSANGNSQWEGATGQLANDLQVFFNEFEAGSEVFAMTLSSDESSYVDQYGNVYSTSDDTSTTEDITDATDRGWNSQDYGSVSSYSVSYFIGRNSTTADDPVVQQYTVTTNNHAYNVSVYGTTTPIILDMDGDGQLQASGGHWMPHGYSKSNARFIDFDMTGNGFEELMEWAGPNDGILLYQYNTGEQVTGLHMFGSPGGFENGYEKLSALDTNGDNKLTGSELADITVWQDKNSNAKVDSGELQTLSELGITELSTTHEALKSSFVQNGKKKVMWDWHPVMIMAKKTK